MFGPEGFNATKKLSGNQSLISFLLVMRPKAGELPVFGGFKRLMVYEGIRNLRTHESVVGPQRLILLYLLLIRVIIRKYWFARDKHTPNQPNLEL